MCCIILALDHPEYALVLASNRDEFLARPTLPLALHDFHPNASSSSSSSSSSTSSPSSPRYLSGLDALTPSGGTWLGVTPSTSHLSFLTNIADAVSTPPPPETGLKEHRSRGKLVKDWLTAGDGDGDGAGAQSIQEYLSARADKAKEYVGFNLVVGRLEAQGGGLKLGYLTNRGPQAGIARRLEELKPSQRAAAEKGPDRFWTMAMSNDSLDEGQDWQKVCWGRERLAEILAGKKDEEGEEERLVESLFEMLGQSAVKTVTSREELKSALCVPPLRLLPPGSDPKDPKTGPPTWYATRTSTVLLVRRAEVAEGRAEARALMIERDRHALDEEGTAFRVEERRAKEGQRRFEVKLEAHTKG